MMTYVWTMVGIIAVLAIWVILFYGFMGWNDAGEKYFAPLRRRHALVSKLIDTVRAQPSFQRGKLEEVVQALNMAKIARGLPQTAQTEHNLSGALRALFADASACPAVEAAPDFQQLRAQIMEIAPEINGVLEYCMAPRVTHRPW